MRPEGYAKNGAIMKTWLGRFRPVKMATPIRSVTMSALAVVLVGAALPARAQDTMGEARIRKMEAEIRALQRQVFPGASGDKLFAPEITPGQPAASATTAPSSTAVTDLLTRMDTVESQLARLTAQIELTSNRLSILEARSAVGTADAAATTAATTPAAASPAAADSNLSAMTGGASAAAPKPCLLYTSPSPRD